MNVERIRVLSQSHRKTYLALLCSIYAIALLISHYAFNEPARQILLDQLKYISAALVTVLFAFLVFVPFIPAENGGEITEIHPQKITPEIELLLRTANRWRYRGNFGRHLREKVLPTLSNRQNVHVIACLIDPSDVELCDKHAKYRSSVNSIEKGQKYNADVVSKEIVVTLVIASWYVVNRRMDISIFLNRAFDPIRIDSNDHAMLLTVEDRRSPALKITSNHSMYHPFELEMQSARDQSRAVQLGGIRSGIELAEINENDVLEVIKTAELQQVLMRVSAEDIRQACMQSKNPHED